jgi:hypothetical protein
MVFTFQPGLKVTMESDLIKKLNSFFGFSGFRPGQEEAIQSLLSGKHTVEEAGIESCGLDLMNLYRLA